HYGCGSCHTIGGMREAKARVGPRLVGLKEQGYLAGRLPNVPHYLVYWIRDPQRYDPGNAMPDLGVTEGDARDIAAYLYSRQ
ncbi:MAG TPA: c-type cytochrome, partial [Armatimonadota bacterium]|nr:c-type cytochrome [Armatimonadota bacterium]